MKCILCPRNCNIDRSYVKGFCGVGEPPVVSSAFLHHWEEPCISGSRGSGTVFFTGCNLKCVFCQNCAISQEQEGKSITTEKLADIFMKLQQMGAHNINLVTPGHFLLQISEALSAAKDLNIPVIYNTNGYDSINSLRLLIGKVNVYLPDLKYFSKELAQKYSGACDYFETASAAILEMYRQTGPAVFDDEGLIKSGLIIRHLILPGHTEDTIRLLEWIKQNLPQDIHISIMSQYTPYHKAAEHPEINRRLTSYEYGKVLRKIERLGFINGYLQERSSSSEEYIPDFESRSIDF